jgi:type IX secretion system PorP/SprF family membrane protein
MRFIKLTVLVYLFTCGYGISQQLPQFSQYIFNGLYINPAYAGYKNEGYLQSTYRSQWSGFEGAPKTFTTSADFSLNEGSMGVGGILVSDRIGPTDMISVSGVYSYRIQTDERSFLSMGTSIGFSQYRLYGHKLRPIDEGDPLIPDGTLNSTVPNLNLGIFFHTDGFYTGLSGYNLIGKTDYSGTDIDIQHNVHMFFTMGGLIDVSDNVKFKPSTLLKKTNGSPLSYDINSFIILNEILWLGVSYRSNSYLGVSNIQRGLTNRNSVSFIGEMFVTKQIRLGYSYDYNLNVLQNMGVNSHEFSLGYYVKHRDVKMKNPRWF